MTVAAPGSLLCLEFAASQHAVRVALADVRGALAKLPIAEETVEAVELVLAEALNNVIKHAYADSSGLVRLEIDADHDTLSCALVDHGRPMPDGQPPQGRSLTLDLPLEDLPEGGFGWLLIRALTSEIGYVRGAGSNRLLLRLPLTQPLPTR